MFFEGGVVEGVIVFQSRSFDFFTLKMIIHKGLQHRNITIFENRTGVINHNNSRAADIHHIHKIPYKLSINNGGLLGEVQMLISKSSTPKPSFCGIATLINFIVGSKSDLNIPQCHIHMLLIDIGFLLIMFIVVHLHVQVFHFISCVGFFVCDGKVRHHCVNLFQHVVVLLSVSHCII
jgi:hypothetical protein